MSFKKVFIIIFSITLGSILSITLQNELIQFLSENITKPVSFNFLEFRNFLELITYWFNSSVLWLLKLSCEKKFIQMATPYSIILTIIVNLFKNLGFIFGNKKFKYTDI